MPPFVAFLIILFRYLKCRSRFKSHYMPLPFFMFFNAQSLWMICYFASLSLIRLAFSFYCLSVFFTLLFINTRWSLYDGSQSPWLAFGFSGHTRCQKMSPNLRTHLHVPFVCLSVCFAPSWLAVPSTLLSVGVIFNLRNPALVQCVVGTTPKHLLVIDNEQSVFWL